MCTHSYDPLYALRPLAALPDVEASNRAAGSGQGRDAAGEPTVTATSSSRIAAEDRGIGPEQKNDAAETAKSSIPRLSLVRVGFAIAGIYLALLGAAGQAMAQSSGQPPLTPPVPHRPSHARALAPSGRTIIAGRTAGSFAVSSIGAATYTIPIWAPPGPQGLQPHIAVTYNSQDGNGYLGVGWGLSGLSVITRCNLTSAQDASPAPVTLTYSDRFCLDGKRLRLTSSENLSTYGENGTRYQTEVADFSQVTANGTAGNGPASFTVQTKDGLIYTYGNGGNSQVVAPGTTTASSWYLSEVSDRAGNTMTIAYNLTTGSTPCIPAANLPAGTAVPCLISWTPTTHGASTYNYTMNFTYTGNIPQSSFYGYVSGSFVQNTALLSSIAIASSGTTVKNYVLSYQASPTTSRSELTQVQECADAGATNCLSPTQITYPTSSAQGVTSTSTSLPSVPGGGDYRYDFNGDGLRDFTYIGSGGHRFVQLNTGSGFGAPIDTGIVGGAEVLGDVTGTGADGILVANGDWWYYTYNSSTNSFTGTDTGLPINGNFVQYGLADLNGDGLPALVALDGQSLQTEHMWCVQIFPNTSSGGSAHFSSNSTGYCGPSQMNALLTPTLFVNSGPASGTRLLDFNGDGRADLVIQFPYTQGSSTLYHDVLLYSNGNSSFTALDLDVAASDPTLLFGSFNDDRCTDVMFNDVSNGTELLLSPCEDQNLPPGNLIRAGGVYTLLAAMDWNAEGRTAAIYSSGGTLSLLASNGNGLVSQSATIPSCANNAFFVFDIDGDGLDDLGCLASTPSYWAHAGNGGLPDLVSSITDGFAMQVSFTYSAITSGAAYSPDIDSAHGGPDPTYPHSGGATLDPVYSGPLSVVSQLSTSDGTGSNYTDSFWYYGARMNHQGRGFDGFYARRTLDSRNSLYTYEYFRRDFPYTGMLWGALKDQPDNSTAMDNLTNTVLATESLDGTQYNTRQFPYVSSSVDSAYEVAGSENGELITQKTTTLGTPDVYGNFSTTQVATTDEDPASPFRGNTFTQLVSTHFSYGSPSSDWCIHIPDAVSVQNTLPDNTSLTRHYGSQGSGVDYTNCRVTDEYIEAGSTTLAVTTHYAFDAWGNHSSVTVTGRNPDGTAMAARTTNYTFGTSGQLPEVMTHAISPTNLTTNITYNYSFGVPSQLQDPNGLITKWTQDPFGRLQTETRPDNTSSIYTYYNCYVTQCGGPSDLRLSVFRDDYGSDGKTLIGSDALFWDGLNRQRYHQRIHAFGTTVNEQVNFYDSLGRTDLSYQPYSTSGNGYTSFNYDLRDRRFGANLYQSNGTLDRSTVWDYVGRTTVITDPRNNNTTQVRDVIGQLRRITDPSPGTTSYYDFDWFGNLIKVTDPINAVSTATYNLRGFLTKRVDKDLGTWNYNGDSLNELVSWTDNKSQSFGAAYDALGRMQSRTEPEGTSTWTWDVQPSGCPSGGKYLGLLTGESGYGYTQTGCFDSIGRLQTRLITTDQNYQYDFTYDAINGAIATVTYPAGPPSTRFKIQNAYSYLYPTQITDVTNPNSPVTLWTLNAVNDYESATSETFGGGSAALSVSRGYKAWTDELTSVQSGVSGSTTNRQNLAYQWDVNGNLTRRQDLNQSLTEVFTPDQLNRLQSVTGPVNLSMSYDAAGDITSRSDIGSYTYGDSNHVHGVTAAGNLSFAYDGNGNVSSRNGLSITWASYNLPTCFQAAGGGSCSANQFSYGPDHQRYQQSATYSNGTEVTHYAGGLFEKVTGSDLQNITWYRNYVPTPSGLTVIVANNSNSLATTTYVAGDHLGSSDALVDGATGNLLVRESFGAFGLRRSGSTWSGAPTSGDYTAIAQATRRGFTFQEELDNIALIHMNGRVYDPNVGRFLSADPFIPDLTNSQSYNRYSYVNNNPLSLIDPSGLDDCSSVSSSGATVFDGPPWCNPDADFPDPTNVTTIVVTAPFWDWGFLFPQEGEYCALASDAGRCLPSPLAQPEFPMQTITVSANRLNSNPCANPPPLDTSADRWYDPADPATHDYYVYTQISGTAAQRQQVEDKWRNGPNAGPGIQPNYPDMKQALLTNQLFGLPIGPDANWIYIRPTVNGWVNVTLPGHFLYAGKVENTVTYSSGTITLATHGTGNTPYGALNVAIGTAFFKLSQLEAISAFLGAPRVQIGGQGTCNQH